MKRAALWMACPFHPYYTVHDIFGVTVFLFRSRPWCVLCARVRRLLPGVQHFIPADPLKTPNHIAPVWYFTPFYSMFACHHQRDDVYC